MRLRRLPVLAALAAVLVSAAACGDDAGGDDLGSSGGGSYELKKAGDVPASATLDKIKSRGKLVVGTKFDQPLFGLNNPTSGKVEGFDTEIGRLLATYLFGDPDKVEFVETISKNREEFIKQGKVDVVIATYTINDTRKQQVAFAGPYYVAGQDVMVKKGNPEGIKGVEDLNGKKVCTVEGSTSEKNVKEKASKANVMLFDTYTTCAEALRDGRVVAETTDNVILLGLISKNKDDFELVGNPFTQEPYGIGLAHDDKTFRDFVNDFLEKIYDNGDWKKAFEKTAGTVAEDTPEPPKVDRY